MHDMDNVQLSRNEKSELKWLEGLILLILILITILVGSFTSNAGYKTIVDEPVGLSSQIGTIDNLE